MSSTFLKYGIEIQPIIWFAFQPPAPVKSPQIQAWLELSTSTTSSSSSSAPAASAKQRFSNAFSRTHFQQMIHPRSAWNSVPRWSTSMASRWSFRYMTRPVRNGLGQSYRIIYELLLVLYWCSISPIERHSMTSLCGWMRHTAYAILKLRCC